MIYENGSGEEKPPKEKNYDTVKPNRDFPLYRIEDYMNFLFDIYKYLGRRILGVDCEFNIMDMAESCGLQWTYIYSRDIFQNQYILRLLHIR